MTGAAGSAYIIEDQRRMSRARNYFDWQARLILPELGRRVVEFGCGIGNFTARLAACEAIVAVDADAACVDILKQRFPRIDCLVRDVGNQDVSDLARFRPDSCLFINVLEHIENDRAALCDAASILPPGGNVILLMPAFRSLFGPIDRNLGHFRRYSRRDIRELAGAAELQIEKIHFVNSIGFFGWWTNARIFRREAQSETQIAFYDRFIVPFLSHAEALAHPPFGQSILAVLRKPL